MPAPTDSLRADARRNRDQILAAAAHTFVEVGADVPMDEIARTAGVGIGTLYRRFPDRESLMVAVVQRNLQALLDKIAESEAESGPLAWDALVRSMSYSRELRLSLPSTNALPPRVAAAVRADEGVHRLRQQLTEATDRLVAAAQGEGSMRTDVGAGDVAELFRLVYRAAPRADDDPADLAASRLLAIVLDGLRTGGHTELPGRPRDTGDLERG